MCQLTSWMRARRLGGAGGAEQLDQPREGAFSIIPTWRRLQGEGRLFGAVMDAFWMHVGDPAARDAAEARLR